MRTGDLARRLLDAGYSVTWWTSRFDHQRKIFRTYPSVFCPLGPRYTVALLEGPGYGRNMSWQRVRHYRSIAAHFSGLAGTLCKPALVLGSYPSAELCDAGRCYARRQHVPFIVDIRDPWPDIFRYYLPTGLGWILLPALWYYRRKIRAIARDATSIVAVSRAMLEWGIGYSRRARAELDQVFPIGFRRHPQDRKIVVPERFTETDPLVCLFATTCGKSYDGKLLIDAARILTVAGDHRVRFVVTGDGEMRSQWIAHAKGLTCVNFTGWIPDAELEAHFRAAHLGLVLLKGGIVRFWLGNKIFEYLSAFLGVVNDVVGEPAEIVSSRDVGINVDRQNPESLAQGLRALADDPGCVRRYMENARRSFKMEFDREAIEAKYLEYLRGVILIHRKQNQGTQR